MQDTIDFGMGILAGGLGLSVVWGLFWLVIGTVGFARGSCSWRVVLNSAVVWLIPSCLVLALFWMRGAGQAIGEPFAAGFAIMPLVLIGFGLRRAPDGQRAGSHMLDGVRHLMDELLGKHRGCSGCSHEEGHEHGGCG